MQSTVLSRRDLDFLLFEWLRVQDLSALPRFVDHSRETLSEVLEVSARIAERYFAPHNKEGDANEPTFDGTKVTVIDDVGQALDAAAAAGLIGMSMSDQHGGLQLPASVAQACCAWLAAANVSTYSYLMLTNANANLLARFGTQEQCDTWIAPMIAGRFSGTMALSESHAGSSLADLQTRAEPRDRGTYRLFGTKMWISGAEHEMTDNIVNLVLARIPGSPPGTRGISLFIVPKYLVTDGGAIGERNDVTISGLNHKMGQRGITNAVLNFGDGAYRPAGDAGAVGYLVGEVNRGLFYMFHMMNEARLGVGTAAVALGYTGYLKSVKYAKERAQGRAIATKDPLTPQVPIIEHADVKRMLLAQKAYVEGGLALALYCARLVDVEQASESIAERQSAALLLDILTPVAKSWPSQWCLEANNLAIQVHGGYGYTREYEVEQHYRDNRLNPIHEGTVGIQSLDLLGRKVTQHGGAGLLEVVNAVTTTVTEATSRGGEAAALATRLDTGWRRLQKVTSTLIRCIDRDAATANSVTYLEAFGHLVVAWMWLEQFIAVGVEDGDFYEGKRQAARYFFRYEMPRTATQLDLLESLDRTTVDMRSEWF